jgi:hypothetical protein
MTFGHDFFGNNDLVLNAVAPGLIGPGGEQQLPQPVETTLTTQTSDEGTIVVTDEKPTWTAKQVTGVILMGLTVWLGFNLLTGRPLEYSAENTP